MDDDKVLANALNMKFKNRGFATNVCYDGEVCSMLMQKERFDVMLFDLQVPKKDGLTLLQEKSTSPNVDTPTYIITGIGGDEAFSRARELGAKACFMKTHTPLSTVVETIQQAVGAA
jgi:DNA-binding response OmpR family regulator